jgi:3,4-dihydroxy 2-butanone 4-phosphate synthase/GTP cyclohydrolase II
MLTSSQYTDLFLRQNTVDMKIMTSIRTAIESLRKGQPVLIIDDEIEGEGDVCIPAQMASPQVINFMATSCRGIICQPITPEMASHLELPLMVPNGGSPAFTVSVDAVGVGSGTSAFDRAKTARVIAHPGTAANDLNRPGHIFPIIARAGGVLERAGHTEASTDIVRLAGLVPSAVICEVMDEDGHMAEIGVLKHFTEKFNMPTFTVRELIEFRRRFDKAGVSGEKLLEQPAVEIPENGNGNGKGKH